MDCMRWAKVSMRSNTSLRRFFSSLRKLSTADTIRLTMPSISWRRRLTSSLPSTLTRISLSSLRTSASSFSWLRWDASSPRLAVSRNSCTSSRRWCNATRKPSNSFCAINRVEATNWVVSSRMSGVRPRRQLERRQDHPAAVVLPIAPAADTESGSVWAPALQLRDRARRAVWSTPLCLMSRLSALWSVGAARIPGPGLPVQHRWGQ